MIPIARLQVTSTWEDLLPETLGFLRLELLGNSLLNWGIAAVVGIVAFFAVGLALRFAAGRLDALARRTGSGVLRLLGALLRDTKGPVLLVFAVWAASLTLTLSPIWAQRLGVLVSVTVLVQFAFWGTQIVNWVIQEYRIRQLEEDPGAATTIGAIGVIARILVWSLVGLMVLGSMGIEIGPLIAGLGIGGIAIALAVQNILGDLFASLSIVFDRPFVIGDFIIVGDQMGTVEHVGLKTTRVRSLSGEQLVFSNSDLLNSRVRNFKRMDERRIVFHFGVQYDTGYEKLRRIPGMVRETIEPLEDTRFDRAHFHEFGDSSLDFEVVYYMLVPEYGAYMDRQEVINLELYRRFEEEGIAFAFPTRTLHLHVDGADAEVKARVVPTAGDQ